MRERDREREGEMEENTSPIHGESRMGERDLSRVSFRYHGPMNMS